MATGDAKDSNGDSGGEGADGTVRAGAIADITSCDAFKPLAVSVIGNPDPYSYDDECRWNGNTPGDASDRGVEVEVTGIPKVTDFEDLRSALFLGDDLAEVDPPDGWSFAASATRADPPPGVEFQVFLVGDGKLLRCNYSENSNSDTAPPPVDEPGFMAFCNKAKDALVTS